MKLLRCSMLQMVIALATTIVSVAHCFNIPLPGGRSVRFEEGGIIRIQYEKDASDLPPMPERGTRVSTDVLQSLEIRDTGTPKGFGVYCTNPLQKHTFLGFYEGTLVKSREELDQRNAPKDYVMSVDGGATFLDGYQRAQDRSSMSPVHLNHEDKDKEGCNCLRILEAGNVAFFTSRPIKIGEELCFDYGDNFWQGREDEKV